MGNTFRSKEVYKKLPKEIHGINTMVPVYGVYVSGQHQFPYYANNGLTINGISCTKTTVTDFEKDYVNTYDDFSMGLMSITVDKSWNIQEFEKDYVNTYEDFSMGLMSITIDNPDLTIIEYPFIKKDMTPEPGIRISQITSNKATISTD